jgi:hypothetical protein
MLTLNEMKGNIEQENNLNTRAERERFIAKTLYKKLWIPCLSIRHGFLV